MGGCVERMDSVELWYSVKKIVCNYICLNTWLVYYKYSILLSINCLSLLNVV